MSSLIPESRVNKNGVPVIKYVRSDQTSRSSYILSRIIPAISPSQRAAAKERHAEIIASLKDEMDQEEEAAIKAEDGFGTTRISKDFRIFAQYQSLATGREIDPRLTKIKTYSLDTLEKLNEAFSGSGKVTETLNASVRDESTFRSFLNFRNCHFSSTDIDTIISNVQSSIGTKDLAEVEFGSEAHDLVSAVIRVASESQQRRHNAHYANEKADSISGMFAGSMFGAVSTWLDDQQILAKMTRDIAAVIVDYPDRVEDIIDYISDRELILEDVDSEHLRLHLENPASSLSSGIL